MNQADVCVESPSSGIFKYNIQYVWMISLVAAWGGFLFGYDLVVIGGAKPFFEKYFQMDGGVISGWANSCAMLGCLFGSIVSGSLSDKFGRKKLFLVSAVLFTASSILTGWAFTFSWFVIWRMAGGVAIGMASTLSPMYIAEVAPAHIRGRLVAVNQLTIVVGLLVAQFINMLIAEQVPEGATADMIRDSWNGRYGWRWMFTAVAIPSALFFFIVMLIPESPRWLMKKGRIDLAHRILSKIGSIAYADTAVGDIKKTLTIEENESIDFKYLFNPKIIKILGIGLVLVVLQQWCGINVIYSYAEEIYRNAGYGVSETLFNIVTTGCISVVFTWIAIMTVDKFGRRILMLIGSLSIGISHFLIGIFYAQGIKGLPVLMMTLFVIAIYTMSLAPVVWVLISEIFPNRIRGAAMSIAVSSLWIACFVLTFTFPILHKTLGATKTFWSYGIVCLTGFAFILKYVPETKGKTLEAIEEIWTQKSSV